MRTAQELRAAANLLCSEIEENQILFSYYEFTEDEQEVILGHFIEYLSGKPVELEEWDYLEDQFSEEFTTEYDFFISFSFLKSKLIIHIVNTAGFHAEFLQHESALPIFLIWIKGQELSLPEGTAHEKLKIFLDSCVFKNHLKTTA